MTEYLVQEVSDLGSWREGTAFSGSLADAQAFAIESQVFQGTGLKIVLNDRVVSWYDGSEWITPGQWDGV